MVFHGMPSNASMVSSLQLYFGGHHGKIQGNLGWAKVGLLVLNDGQTQE